MKNQFEFPWSIAKCFIVGGISLVAALSCSHKETGSAQREPAQAKVPAYGLPDSDKWAYVYQMVNDFDFNREDTTLKLSSGGTSVYAVVSVGGKVLGATIPENSATSLSGEIMAFNLSRVLGVSDLYQPGVYYNLTGNNLKKFMELVPKTPLSGNKEENRKKILERYQNNSQEMPTVFKPFGTKPKDYDDLVGGNTLSNHKLPGSMSTVKEMLTCSGAQPSKNRSIMINGGSSTEYQLIKQLSTIFLIDALTKQWDRFSGGNLQTLTENGQVKFISFDNGGTWGGDGWTNKFLAIVTRFDSEAVDQILKMNDFLTQGGTFMGLRNEQEFIQAMGIEKFPNVMKSFKGALNLVAQHVRKNSQSPCRFE